MTINPNCPNCKTHNQVFSTDAISDFSKKHWENKRWHCNKCDIQFDEEMLQFFDEISAHTHKVMEELSGKDEGKRYE